MAKKALPKAVSVKIENIKPNEDNPRFIRDENFEKLVNSIEKFPQMLELRPIVVNAEMVVLGGNMRLNACKAAGLESVPVIKAENLTPEQQREFIIKDNAGFGEWDWQMLANEWEAEELEEWGLTTPDNWNIEEDEEGGEMEETDNTESLTFKLSIEQAFAIKKALQNFPIVGEASTPEANQLYHMATKALEEA